MVITYIDDECFDIHDYDDTDHDTDDDADADTADGTNDPSVNKTVRIQALSKRGVV